MMNDETRKYFERKAVQFLVKCILSENPEARFAYYSERLVGIFWRDDDGLRWGRFETTNIHMAIEFFQGGGRDTVGLGGLTVEAKFEDYQQSGALYEPETNAAPAKGQPPHKPTPASSPICPMADTVVDTNSEAFKLRYYGVAQVQKKTMRA